MNIIEAITALENGEKVKLRTWAGIWLEKDTDGIIKKYPNKDAKSFIKVSDLSMRDEWEIVK